MPVALSAIVGPLDCGCAGSTAGSGYRSAPPPHCRRRPRAEARSRRSRDRAMDQPGIRGLEHVVRQAEPLHRCRDGSSPTGHRRARRARAGSLGPHRCAGRAQCCACRGCRRRNSGCSARRENTERDRRRCGLDLDHLGAEVGEHQAGERRGDHRAQLDDPHALENSSRPLIFLSAHIHRSCSRARGNLHRHCDSVPRFRGDEGDHGLAFADDASTSARRIGTAPPRQGATGILLNHQDTHLAFAGDARERREQLTRKAR